MNHDNNEPQHQTPGVPDGNRKHPGSEGRRDVPPHPEPHAPTSAPQNLPTGEPLYGTAVPANVSFSAQLVQQQLNQNYPDPDTSAELREKAPEVYEAWLQTTRQTIETDNYVRKAEVDNPRKMATRGLVVGAIVVLALFALAAYATYLRQQWLAGFLVTIDVVLLASIFTGNTAPKKGDGGGS